MELFDDFAFRLFGDLHLGRWILLAVAVWLLWDHIPAIFNWLVKTVWGFVTKKAPALPSNEANIDSLLAALTSETAKAKELLAKVEAFRESQGAQND
jgi:hypothetical protein